MISGVKVVKLVKASQLTINSSFKYVASVTGFLVIIILLLAVFGIFVTELLHRIGRQTNENSLSRYYKDKFALLVNSPLDLDFSLSSFGLNRGNFNHGSQLDGTRFESQHSIKSAKDMMKNGKHGKAMKIYLHALALDPHNPELLNSYGEFLETYQKDIVQAERIYLKALTLNSSHTKALQNHRRTSPLVEQIDGSRFERIDAKLATLLQVPDNHPGLRRQSYEQYVRLIHHSTAMEGNTFTLSQTRSFLENGFVITGKSIIEHNEILGMEAAMQFLNSSLLHRMGKFTVRDIKELHRRVLGYVDPIGSGIYRSTQVYVGHFVPPRPDLIESLMVEFVEWLNSEETIGTLHPIKLAALAHYKLVYIHPFYDGNGRTSRMLMNMILMLAGYPPIVIPVEHRQHYYETLDMANEGDVRPFIRFIAECTELTLDEYLLASTAVENRTLLDLRSNYDELITIT